MIKSLSCKIRADLLASAVCLSLLSCSSIAQDAAAIHVGPFDVTPTLELDVERSDNVFLETKGNERSSTLTTVSPTITAVADDGVTRYELSYQLENGRQSRVDNSDYTDHELGAKMDWRVDVRHLIELGVAESRGHDNRSVDSVSAGGATVLTSSELDKTKERVLSANYIFGSEGARGRLAIGFQESSLRYTTNLQKTNVLESDTSQANASFSVGIGASTRALVEVVETENTFLNNAANNRKDRSFLLGVEWEFNDLMKGAVSLGRSRNDLLNTTNGDSSASVGEMSIIWSPVDYSVFTFSASKSAENSENNIGSFVGRSSFTAGWEYKINDRFDIIMAFERQEDDFIGVARKDRLNTSELQLNYAFRRWLNIGLGVSRDDRSSTDQAFDYTGNTVFLSVNTSL